MALFTTLAEDKARLIPGRVKTPANAGDKLFRRWEKIDATVADDLVTAITGQTVTNPQADKQTYTGTFAIGSIKAEAEQDRAVTITQELTLVTTITGIGDLPTTFIVSQENEILNLFGLEDEDGELDVMAYRYDNLDPSNASRKACMEITDANYATRANDASTYPETGWEYEDKKFVKNADNTGTLTVLFRQVAWSNVDTSLAFRVDAVAKTFTKISETNTVPDDGVEPTSAIQVGIDVANVQQAKGVPTDDIKTVLSNLTANDGYAITGSTIRDNGNGSSTISVNEALIRAATVSDPAAAPGVNEDYEMQFNDDNGTDEESQRVTWFNVTEATAKLIITDAKSATWDYAVPPENHVLKSVGISRPRGVDSAGDTMVDCTRVTFIPRNGSGTWWGADSSHYLTGFIRPQDKKQVAIEVLWTDDLGDAEDFVQAGTVGSHSKAAAMTELDTLTDIPLSGWVDGGGILISYDAGNHTGIQRIGANKYKATRVWARKLDDLPFKK